MNGNRSKNAISFIFHQFNGKARDKYLLAVQARGYTITGLSNQPYKRELAFKAALEMDNPFHLRQEIALAMKDFDLSYDYEAEKKIGKYLYELSVLLPIDLPTSLKEHTETIDVRKLFKFRHPYSELTAHVISGGVRLRLCLNQPHHFQKAQFRFLQYLEEVVSWLYVYRRVHRVWYDSRGSRDGVQGEMEKVLNQIAESALYRI